ncbi:hypothetical protein, partial [Aetokthonos hydrillicola]|uniref:hypothetical protein n=1 Tax=Aetokthonos hydrillicola TaxID=1550245 RepID=UPI001ABBD6AB
MSGAAKSISGATISNLQLNNAAGFSLTGSPTITDVLNLNAGALSIGSNTITFHTGNTPIVRTSGTLTTTASSNLVFGTNGNTGGSAFTLPNSLFTTASFGSFTINRTKTLTWNTQSPTLAGDLNLTAGILSTAVNFNLGGNITGTGTQSGSGVISMTGASKTISGATLANLQLNNAAGFSLTGSPLVTDVLTLTNGALTIGNNTLTFQTGNTPIVRNGVSQTGTLTMTATSNLVFGTVGNTAGSAFTLPDNCFTSNPEFASLTINRTNSLTLNNQPMAVRHLLQLTQGTLILPAGYVFPLRSLSIANTAMVGQIGNNAGIQYGTGAIFKVERHIPQTGAGIRAYRDIAPSVNTGSGTIYQNWQESGTNGLENGIYYGTHITGKTGAAPGGVDAASGLDKTQTAAVGVSFMRSNPTTGKSEWISKTSSKLAGDTLTALQGYRVLIRGNRLVNLYQNPTPATMNAGATLRASGKLITGDVVYTTTGTTANGYTNTAVRLNSGELTGFTMLGNPYASPIVWDSLVNNSTNIQPTYWLFDPNVGSAGGDNYHNAPLPRP